MEKSIFCLNIRGRRQWINGSDRLKHYPKSTSIPRKIWQLFRETVSAVSFQLLRGNIDIKTDIVSIYGFLRRLQVPVGSVEKVCCSIIARHGSYRVGIVSEKTEGFDCEQAYTPFLFSK